MKGGKLRPITRWGTPVMHAPTRPITVFDAELHEIVRDMFATMEAAPGVGLAATQIGLDISLFVFNCTDADDHYQYGAVCNPIIDMPAGKDRTFESAEEGCLSLPGGFAPLARPTLATCTGVDPWGEPITVEATGLLARCVQHETDHLNGTVFADRLSGRVRRSLYAEHEKTAHLYPADWPVVPKLDSAT
ncbi:MAG: peptide deformylase [Propionibacteriaceae bacterium]|nr:peptide deformylase [Propionibacteriaceae bacterium]